MVHQPFIQHQPVSQSLDHRQAAGIGDPIGVSGTRSLPPGSYVGMDARWRDPTNP
jgi:hypothetical protein